MINARMRIYNYYTFGQPDRYGQPRVSTKPQGTIKMAINSTSTTIQDNALYKNATYLGLTKAEVKDTYIIEYENTKLKVLYVIPNGKYNQVFMASYE
jgi:hypothetical protein